jgi:cytochrome c oxidase cbb3-type subunit 3
MTNRNDVDDLSGVETTGHEWDGIKELNNPLPRWWLIVFYACILGAVIYWVLFPAWPGLPGSNTYTKGTLGVSDRVTVARDLKALATSRDAMSAKLAATDPQTIEGNPDLMQFAMAKGEAAFKDNCATCHGTGGAGNKGYPNLADDVWLWGGTLDDIKHTITVGVRSTHADTRFSQMPSFGKDEILNRNQISDAAEYVLSLSHRSTSKTGAARGAVIFAEQCASCHGAEAKGDRAVGAPNLTDAEWLYGGTKADIMATIHRGPAGVMPTWQGRLDPATIDALAVYVHARGGGE